MARALRKADHFALCVLWPLGDRVEFRITMTDEIRYRNAERRRLAGATRC